MNIVLTSYGLKLKTKYRTRPKVIVCQSRTHPLYVREVWARPRAARKPNESLITAYDTNVHTVCQSQLTDDKS